MMNCKNTSRIGSCYLFVVISYVISSVHFRKNHGKILCFRNIFPDMNINPFLHSGHIPDTPNFNIKLANGANNILMNLVFTKKV